MSDSPSARADKLRREFDASFTVPATGDETKREAVLAMRAAGQNLAIRTAQISGLARCPAVTAMPSRTPSFVGLVGVRGTLLAVHSVAQLLGSSAATHTGGWLVLPASHRDLALKFEGLEGQYKVDSLDLHPTEGSSSRVTIRLDDVEYVVLDITELVETICRADAVGDEE